MQIGPGAFDELDIGQLVDKRDLLGADRLLDAHRMRRAALDAGIVGRDHAARAGHKPDADDRAAAEDVVGTVVLVHAEAAEARELEKRRVAVEEPVDPLARRQLAALAELAVGAAGGCPDFALEGAEFRDQLEMGGAVGAEAVALDDDARADRWHPAAPSLIGALRRGPKVHGSREPVKWRWVWGAP